MKALSALRYVVAALLCLFLFAARPASAQVAYQGNSMIVTGTVAAVGPNLVTIATDQGSVNVPIVGTTFDSSGYGAVDINNLQVGEPIQAVVPGYSAAAPFPVYNYPQYSAGPSLNIGLGFFPNWFLGSSGWGWGTNPYAFGPAFAPGYYNPGYYNPSILPVPVPERRFYNHNFVRPVPVVPHNGFHNGFVTPNVAPRTFAPRGNFVPHAAPSYHSVAPSYHSAPSFHSAAPHAAPSFHGNGGGNHRR